MRAMRIQDVPQFDILYIFYGVELEIGSNVVFVAIQSKLMSSYE